MTFLATLAGLRTRIVGATQPKVLGAPLDSVPIRAPAVKRGAAQQAAAKLETQLGEIPEVASLKWGAAAPGGGVTIFTTPKGWDLLTAEAEATRWRAAHRIARYMTSQPRWAERSVDRSPGSVASEIMCHAHPFVNDNAMSIEYDVEDSQTVRCLLLGFDLREDFPTFTPAPDEGVV